MKSTRQREIDESMSTYWIDQSNKGNYTMPAAPIEQDDIAKLVEALLEEFVHTSDEEKVEFRQILTQWLGEMDEADLNIDKVEKLRDLIYEMF